MFALSQKDEFVGKGGKKSKQRQPYLVVGLHLMKVEANRRHRIHQVPSKFIDQSKFIPNKKAINPVATSEYSCGRSVYLHLAELPPGRYLLIPSTFAPREEAEFMLRIYSSNPKLNPIELAEDIPINGQSIKLFLTQNHQSINHFRPCKMWHSGALCHSIENY